MRTRITVLRTDGTTAIVERPGAITDPAVRAQMAEATCAAGRGTILAWEVVGQAPKRPGCHLYSRDQGCPLHGETCR